MVPRRERGFALVAAVTAVAVFGCIAFQVFASDRGAIAVAASREQQARLAAAADAGISLAVHGLGSANLGDRWSIDGRPHRLQFDGFDLTVTIEDERGKAPLAGLSDNQARALFSGAGATGDRLDALVAEFRDWQTDDRANPDPDSSQPAQLSGPPVRHGPFRTVGELAALKDMTPEIFARVAPAVTVFFEDNGPFDPDHAQPLAKAAMNADTLDNPDQIDNETQMANERPDEEITTEEDLTGRPLTVQVVASARDGAHTHRMEIIEFTGDKAQPFWVRYAE